MTSPPEMLVARLAGLTLRDRHRLGRRLERAARQGGEKAARELARLSAAIEEAEARREARRGAVPPVTYPEDLPVSAHRDELSAAIAAHQVVVVAGETGSGKTTQLPKVCLELGRGVEGMIGHTQPRRLAARTVAERLAEELGVPLGGPVGYSVRFTDTVTDTTLVKVMTDGILLAEIRRDRLLRAYDTIIVDEAHERSLNIDFLLGYLTQLLPKRPDLKVVITSATIDTARFAAHFSAPVVEVSGRTYPVELRYRPVGAEGGRETEQDLNGAICEAVGELVAEGPGDVLVFLPGERDIRDAAEALRGAGPEGVEVLPLYARLSAAEQHRVFRPHRGRRVVLATNVAETSLTVPGVRFVVDTGLARVSRFSHRTKVQRLPIEAISRASADQRAGRCGRIAPGVCIRLYAEDDYEARPAFTDPEILRTNLASVILQMAAIGLGEVEAFPFLEPPDRRAVADGRSLLEELGAFDRRDGRIHLTPIGRRLAELPLDPRLGRMVLEAERLGCLREVTVVAAALSIQDPRERPADAIGAADAAHERFVVPDSDFLGFVRLFDYLAGLQAELSGNQFRRRCRAEYLSVLRVREWQDIAGQIRQALRAQGSHASTEPARAELVHRALLAGLLSQIGLRDRARGDYLGARSSRWQIGRGSALASHPPRWAMAGALVETEGTWARTVARIDPAWAEQVGAHLVRRNRSEPWWDAERGEAVVEERISLFGLPIVAGRLVSLASSDPAAARRLFVQRALVERDWPIELAPLEVTRTRIERVSALEERVRRHGLLAGGGAVFGFYDALVPEEVTGGKRFLRWWRQVASKEPGQLEVPFSVLLDPGAGPVDLAAYPDRWVQDGLELPLRYRWEPGAPDDGVTVEVPLAVLNRVRQEGFDWHVAGARLELLTALVRSLPKSIRRSLVPIAATAERLAATAGPEDGPLLETLADALARSSGVPVAPELFDLDALPAHLRLRFEVVDEEGQVRGVGRDLDRLRRSLGGEIRAAVAGVAPELERRGATSWEFGDLPREIERGEVKAYPSLVDEGQSVGVVLLETPSAQADSMWQATRRLLLLAAPLPAGQLRRRLTNEAVLALAGSSVPLAGLLADCATAVVDRIIDEAGGPAFDEASFEAMAATARLELGRRVARLVGIAAEVLAGAGRVEARLAALRGARSAANLGGALDDVGRQLGGLVGPGFVTAAGEARFEDLRRYLEATLRRLERLPADAGRDAERQAVVDRVQARYDLVAAELAAGVAPKGTRATLFEVRWMIEELRVSLWAQALGTRAPVSEARILRALGRRRA